MKNITKKFLLAVIPAIAILFTANAQTNVSGGIFANTTWTTANSPYIVTSTVVVFPGFSLTIQPGVTVKFADGQQLEIRQAQLIATGTSIAPITFTSNSGSPTPGIYSGLFLNAVSVAHTLDYCNFFYADNGIRINSDLTVTNSNFISNNTGISGLSSNTGVTINNCVFRSNAVDGLFVEGGSITNSRIVRNGTGLDALGWATMLTNCVVDSNSTGVHNASGTFAHCSFNHNGTGISENGGLLIDSCTINSNTIGIGNLEGGTVKNSVIDFNSGVGVYAEWTGASVLNCEIKNNAIGIWDFRTGNLSNPHNTITNNIIENDSIGIMLAMHAENVYCNRICNNSAYGIKYTDVQNTSIANNYWCINDSASVETAVYDAHDNVSYGILTIMPLDTVQCYLNSNPTGIINYGSENFSFNIFPNPATDNLTITFPSTVSKAEIKIFNMVGELEYSSTTNNNNTEINVSNLGSGMHIIQVAMGNSIVRQKFIKQ